MGAYDAELVAQGLQTLLEDEMEDALDTVEVAWASDPVTLPDVVTWHFGHKPTVLEMDSDEFPFVSVISTGAKPKGSPSSALGFQEETLPMLIDYVVVATTEENCNKICHRYAEAIRTILLTEKTVEGYRQVNRKPDVSISEVGVTRHGVTTESDMLISEDEDVNYIQMGRVEVTFEGGN